MYGVCSFFSNGKLLVILGNVSRGIKLFINSFEIHDEKLLWMMVYFNCSTHYRLLFCAKQIIYRYQLT